MTGIGPESRRRVQLSRRRAYAPNVHSRQVRLVDDDEATPDPGPRYTSPRSRTRAPDQSVDVRDADREERGPEGSPESVVVDHITNVTLLTAVKQLNPEQQECIVLRFLQGFSVAETAQAMNKNEGAIKALQYRAVRALNRLLPEGFQK
jgi:RNA polymerase sigma factor (sigma-70 family)